MKPITHQFFRCAISVFIALVLTSGIRAQYQSFKISPNGDTLNIVDKDGLKQGRWVVHVDPLRGEPGYEAEGVFVNNKKEGTWRKYNLMGDFLSLENYHLGGKDGKSLYFTRFGQLIREENWRGYDPYSPYDTIPIYGQSNNEILSYKIVKAEPYSVKHGDWTFYDPQTGRIIKVDKYDHGRLISDKNPNQFVISDSMRKVKPTEILEYEKKNKGKKRIKVRDGQTHQ